MPHSQPYSGYSNSQHQVMWGTVVHRTGDLLWIPKRWKGKLWPEDTPSGRLGPMIRTTWSCTHTSLRWWPSPMTGPLQSYKTSHEYSCHRGHPNIVSFASWSFLIRLKPCYTGDSPILMSTQTMWQCLSLPQKGLVKQLINKLSLLGTALRYPEILNVNHPMNHPKTISWIHQFEL